jgi:outer membrane protein assembly factor BamE (lipoprotein component of BamABCDE complex)
MWNFSGNKKKRIAPGIKGMALATARICMVAAVLTACAGQIDQHGHLFTDVDLQQIQPGMSQDQVRLTLGTPDTTGTIDGDVFYYISSKRKTLPAGKPKVIDRKVVAVYFDRNQSVREVAHYGLQDGRIINFVDGETPTYGKKLTALEQLFGNIANRRSLLQSSQ